ESGPAAGAGGAAAATPGSPAEMAAAAPPRAAPERSCRRLMPVRSPDQAGVVSCRDVGCIARLPPLPRRHAVALRTLHVLIGPRQVPRSPGSRPRVLTYSGT